MRKEAAPAKETATQVKQPNHIRPATKVERVLTALIRRGSLNRVEAERAPVFDHSLNSTMSCDISRRLGLSFTSRPEVCQGYAGLQARYHRYSLVGNSVERAKSVVDQLRLKRGADPVNWSTAEEVE